MVISNRDMLSFSVTVQRSDAGFGQALFGRRKLSHDGFAFKRHEIFAVLGTHRADIALKVVRLEEPIGLFELRDGEDPLDRDAYIFVLLNEVSDVGFTFRTTLLTLERASAASLGGPVLGSERRRFQSGGRASLLRGPRGFLVWEVGPFVRIAFSTRRLLLRRSWLD